LQSLNEKIAELTALRDLILQVNSEGDACCNPQLTDKNCGIFEPASQAVSASFRSILG
jgi:hypothetical protein